MKYLLALAERMFNELILNTKKHFNFRMDSKEFKNLCRQGLRLMKRTDMNLYFDITKKGKIFEQQVVQCPSCNSKFLAMLEVQYGFIRIEIKTKCSMCEYPENHQIILN